MINNEIGKKIAAYRSRHNLTIRQLAEETGLSSALLSQLERGMGNPTLYALSSLADTLGISISQLVERPTPNASLILRKKDRSRVYTACGQALYDVVSSRTAHSRLELLFLELPPHTCTEGGLSVHPTEEEIALVLEGETTIHFAEEHFLLEEGDSIRILPGRGHMLENTGEQPLKVLFARYQED